MRASMARLGERCPELSATRAMQMNRWASELSAQTPHRSQTVTEALADLSGSSATQKARWVHRRRDWIAPASLNLAPAVRAVCANEHTDRLLQDPGPHSPATRNGTSPRSHLVKPCAALDC